MISLGLQVMNISSVNPWYWNITKKIILYCAEIVSLSALFSPQLIQL